MAENNSILIFDDEIAGEVPLTTRVHFMIESRVKSVTPPQNVYTDELGNIYTDEFGVPYGYSVI